MSNIGEFLFFVWGSLCENKLTRSLCLRMPLERASNLKGVILTYVKLIMLFHPGKDYNLIYRNVCLSK